MVGSIRSLRSARSRASVRSSSEPASLLYPTTSDASIAASFRVSGHEYLPQHPDRRLGFSQAQSSKLTCPALNRVTKLGAPLSRVSECRVCGPACVKTHRLL